MKNKAQKTYKGNLCKKKILKELNDHFFCKKILSFAFFPDLLCIKVPKKKGNCILFDNSFMDDNF